MNGRARVGREVVEMKMLRAREIIAKGTNRGFRVHLEWKKGSFLHSDYFPEREEPLIETEAEAWALAVQFADGTIGEAYNIYVVDSKSCPITNYSAKMLNRR